MGYTVEDMLLRSSDRYHMKLIAGENGWSNSISWLMMIEDLTIIRRFDGKELAVTTCMGFDSTEKLLQLLQNLIEKNAAGLIVNVGEYISQVPGEIIDYCDENDFPLLTVPWDVSITDMIKDLSVHIFLESLTDEQTSRAFIQAIEHPDASALYRQDLLPYFDLDGTFQVVLFTTGNLDQMDTVERKRLGYRTEIFLENITHNCDFFYYDSCFALIANDLPDDVMKNVLEDFNRRMRIRLPGEKLCIGIGTVMKDISQLHISYARARAAVEYAYRHDLPQVSFDEMGLLRLLSLVPDQPLLEEMGDGILRPLLDYDLRHGSDLFLTLESFLRHGGSYQAMAAEMFVHRNTLMYRMNNIRELLGCSLDSEAERTQYRVACLIHRMQSRSPEK